MRIGIDCRIYGSKHTGIGRYVENLVEELLKQDKENEYVLFIRNDTEQKIKNLKFDIENSLKIEKPVPSLSKDCKLKIVIVDIPHYSLKEQLIFPSIIKKEKVDLMHFTHFNVPVFYRGKYVVTIHDLIKHTSKGSGTTTRSPWLYWLKHLGYKFVFRQAVKKAEMIITPSQFVKEEVVKQYKMDPGKVVVTYEGVDESIKKKVLSIKEKNDEILEKYNIDKPYLLYVGSVYPHKNIERLIETVKLLNQDRIASRVSRIALVIVCARNVFSERLNKYIEHNEAEEIVNMIGFVPDEELSVLLKEAEAFVFPTLSEGFGLPGLEAMSVGCPVICSNIPVLKEVYKDCVVYFDPLNTSEIAGKIKSFLEDKKLQLELKECGRKLAGTYSWSRMASETMEVYNSVK